MWKKLRFFYWNRWKSLGKRVIHEHLCMFSLADKRTTVWTTELNISSSEPCLFSAFFSVEKLAETLQTF